MQAVEAEGLLVVLRVPAVVVEPEGVVEEGQDLTIREPQERQILAAAAAEWEIEHLLDHQAQVVPVS